MTWLDYGFLMFFSSVALYLAVRKSSLIKIPTHITNLAMFGVPLIAYAVIALAGHHKLAVTAWQGLVIVVAAVAFSYLGNTFSLKAIDIAPNPGYSLVLSKSYVLFTTIVAVLFLNSPLTWRKAAAILLVVGFSALIMIDPKETKSVRNNKWVVFSLAAFFAWGFLSLSSRYLFDHGVDTMAFLLYVYAIVTACILGSSRRSSAAKSNHPAKWPLFLLVGIFSTMFNLGNFEAIRLAPNIGYVNAMNAGSIALVGVLAVLLFKDELTLRKAAGILGVTTGLCLLLL